MVVMEAAAAAATTSIEHACSRRRVNILKVTGEGWCGGYTIRLTMRKSNVMMG